MTPDDPPTARRGNFRWVIVALLFLATVINYMDRQILGLLKGNLSDSLHWNDIDYGWIVVAFQASYAIGQLIAGPFIEWIGTKTAYAWSIVLWSLAAMSHALARSAFGFGVARFGLGLGESANFPAAIKTVAEWMPQQDRSLATGFFNTGTTLGAIVAPLIVPWLTLQYGWQTAFVAIGLTGFLWLILWFIFYSPPEKSPWITREELQFIKSNQNDSPQSRVHWTAVLRYRQTWAYIATGIFVGPVWWFYLFWLPDFFNKQFHLDLQHFGLPLVLVYGVTTLGSIVGGWLSAAFLRQGWSLNASRKTASLICAVCTLPVIFSPHVANYWLAAGFFALAASAHQGWSATMYTVVSDIFPKNAVATIVGLGGTFAAVASMVFSWFVSHVLQNTGSYTKIMPICGGAYLAAWIIFHLVVPRIQPIIVTDRRGFDVL